MHFPTRRTFMKTAALGAASLSLVSAQESQGQELPRGRPLHSARLPPWLGLVAGSNSGLPRRPNRLLAAISHGQALTAVHVWFVEKCSGISVPVD